MIRICRKLIKWLYLRIRLLIRLNLIKTFYINFRTQPFGKAIKFPIFVYGRLKILSLRGNFIIEAPISLGMIKIGYKYIDLFPASLIPAQIKITGKLIVAGNLIIGGGVSFFVEGTHSLMKVGKNCTIGGGSYIKATNNVEFGDNVQITGECVIMDCEMHYVRNIETGLIKRNFGIIYIGANCWINQRTIIVKNSIIPKYSITARASYLNKDYSLYGTNLLLFGSPAIPKDDKFQRIFNINQEAELGNYFRGNMNNLYFKSNEGIIDNDNNNCPLFSWIN